MTKRIIFILAISGYFAALFSPIAASQVEPSITFGWNTLDYGRPTVNSSYFIGNGSVASNGSTYHPLIETLPICQTLVELKLSATDCIESLEARVGDGSWTPGKMNRYLPMRWQPRYIKVSDAASNIVEFSDDVIDLPAIPSANIFTGSRAAMWSFDGISHSTGNQFLFYVEAFGIAIDGNADWSQGFLRSNLYPVSISDIKNEKNNASPGNATYGQTGLGTCVINRSRTFCMKETKFPADIRFRVTLKLNRAAASIDSDRWFITRTTNPSLTISSGNPDRRFILEGGPVTVQVPKIQLPRERDVVTSFVKSWMSSVQKQSNDLDALVQKQVEYLLTGNGLIEAANSAGSTRVFAGWEPFFRYAELTELNGWNFSNEGGSLASEALSEKLRSCPKSSRYPGFVSSNSTAIEPGPPVLNNEENSLEYRVAAPHLSASGEQNFGTYSLYVSPEIAKCLWGSNVSSAKATVSIVSDDGSTQVATSVLKNDGNGLYLNVSGFHYSSGSIKLQMKSETSVTTSKPKDVIAKPGQAQPATKRTISCIKGKVIKKVTAQSPKCPSGFKKK